MHCASSEFEKSCMWRCTIFSVLKNRRSTEGNVVQNQGVQGKSGRGEVVLLDTEKMHSFHYLRSPPVLQYTAGVKNQPFHIYSSATPYFHTFNCLCTAGAADCIEEVRCTIHLRYKGCASKMQRSSRGLKKVRITRALLFWKVSVLMHLFSSEA